MKNYYILCLVFLLFGCRPVNVTRQYYDEYVNPKPSISYEALDFDQVPQVFLDDYYAIDSRLVRVSNEIHINDSFDFQSLGGSNDGAWLKSGAVFDDEFLLVRGDDAIGFDPVVRNILNANKFETSTFVSFEERLFWVNIIINASNIKNYIVFEADKAVLSSFKKSEHLHLIVDDVSLKDDMLWSSDKLKAILKSKQYSGAYRVRDKDVYWIRSMAADNLFYFYN